jgi:uncharacterized protein (DUF362 family)
MSNLSRREVLAVLGAAAVAPAKEAPTAPVSVARCRTYDQEMADTLARMVDQLGGLERLVKNKTVTIKLNLTGSPGLKVQGKPLGLTHYTHPGMLEAFLYLLDRAGARRIRLVESCWATAGPLEDYMLDSGWRVRRFLSASSKVEFENTNGIGHGKRYSVLKVPGGGYMFPSYVLNHSYEDTDVYMTIAKLKNHETCGVTLALKNSFGITPASIYGDDAGVDKPNESPTRGRAAVMHFGKRAPAKIAAGEHKPGANHDSGYRVPRVVADLNLIRPIDFAVIDGIETVTGGEGPWIRGVRPVSPGVIIAGTNAVTTDAVATAIMGYDPQADRGTHPFDKCDNTMKLAEAVGIGTTDLKRIEVRGVAIEQARFPFSV